MALLGLRRPPALESQACATTNTGQPSHIPPHDKSYLCCGGSGGGAEVMEDGVHVDAKPFVVAVDGSPGGGFALGLLSVPARWVTRARPMNPLADAAPAPVSSAS